MIGIIDYQLCNIMSVKGALDRLQAPFIVTSNPEDLKKCEKIIVPGVGAFSEAIQFLRQHNLDHAIKDFAKDRPVLGICLGAQLLCERSFEFGEHTGLGLLNAEVVPFASSIVERIPHMGWNKVELQNDSPLTKDIRSSEFFYFVHSFHMQTTSTELIHGKTSYGVVFNSILIKNNIIAAQFHPEKSQKAGIQLLKNFVENY